MSFISDIKDYLQTDTDVAAQFGTTPAFGTNLFISFEPDSPDNCITIYPTPGRKPDDVNKYISSCQIRVRGATFEIAYNTLQKIISKLHLNGDVLGNTNGALVAINSQPEFLIRDDNRRSILVAHFNSKHVKY